MDTPCWPAARFRRSKALESLGSGEAGILAHPSPGRCRYMVGSGPRGSGGTPGSPSRKSGLGDVLSPIRGLDRDAFRRLPHGRRLRRCGVRAGALLELASGESGDARHRWSGCVIGWSQDFRRITALIKEGADPGLVQRGPVGAGLARWNAVRPLRPAPSPHPRPHAHRSSGGASASETHADSLNRFARLSRPCLPPLGCHRIEQALGETRPRIEIGGPAETGEEHFGPGAGFCEMSVAPVAQALERLRQPDRVQRLLAGGKPRAAVAPTRRLRPRRDRENRWCRSDYPYGGRHRLRARPAPCRPRS